MLYGERYVYCLEQDKKNSKVDVTTHIKAQYVVDKAPLFRRISELGYYKLTIRQEKHKCWGNKIERVSYKRIEVRVPACDLEALLKDAKLSYEDKELL